MAPPRATTAWNTHTILDLIACLLNEKPPSQAEIRAVTERMHAMGHTCSQKAITHQFQKMKQLHNNDDNAVGDSGKVVGDIKPHQPRQKKAAAHEVASNAGPVYDARSSKVPRKRGVDENFDFGPGEVGGRLAAKKRRVEGPVIYDLTGDDEVHVTPEHNYPAAGGVKLDGDISDGSEAV